LSRLLDLAREDGWAQLLPRMARAAAHRFRDSFTARKLRAPGFRVRYNPHLSGLAHMRIGRNFSAGDSLWLEAVVEYAGERLSPTLTIGDDVGVSDNVHITCINSVTIGSGTLIGSRVIVTDNSHGVYRGDSQSAPDTAPAKRRLHSPAAVVIGRNVWIGDGVAVLPGATIGDGAIIGANSVVTGTVPAGVIAVGAPVRILRRWNKETGVWEPIG
jgi:acetyltransferase-like isoleucine patch superfamily enzyme